MSTEIIIDHDEIRDPDKVTQVNERKFKEKGLDIHRHEVESLEDDHKKGKRRLLIKSTKTFIMPGAPWKK